MFRMTMLTFDILRRFELEYKTDCYNLDERSTIETDARIAMMNRHYHNEQGENWTNDDIYADFLRCLAIDKINLIPTEPEQPETEPAEADETETNEQEEETMKNVLESIQNAAQKVAVDRAAYIAENTKTAAAAKECSLIRRSSTPKQWERIAAMQDAEPIAEADVEKLTAKAVKSVQKDAQNAADKVREVAQIDAPQFIRLYITWTRSTVWGWNPHCTLTTWTENGSGYRDETTHGRASGCGYDKTSAACAEALNASNIVRGALVRFVNDGGSNYGVYTADTLNYPVCPYFEGGCGMSTITETLRKMGYKVTDTTHYTRRGSEECRIIEAQLIETE